MSEKETEVLQIAGRKRHAHASARHVIAESSGGEKKERETHFSYRFSRVISCAHTRDNSARDRSKGKGKDSGGGKPSERYHEFNDSVDFTTAIAPPLL